MNLSCLIVEDEPMARKLLEQYVARVPWLDLAAALGNPVEALERLNREQPDVLFLDVQMPEITGISLLRILKKKPLVVLTTAYSEYAIEGYELDVSDYLLKPITFERFLKCAEKLRELAGPASGPATAPAAPPPEETSRYLFVKDGTKSVRVDLAEVRYIEGLKDYVRIHTGGKQVTTLQSLKHLVEKLPGERFVRIHHSYIVSVDWIDEIDRDGVTIGKAQLPVSDTYRRGFRKFIEGRHLK